MKSIISDNQTHPKHESFKFSSLQVILLHDYCQAERLTSMIDSWYTVYKGYMVSYPFRPGRSPYTSTSGFEDFKA